MVAVDVFGDNDVLFCLGDRSHFNVLNRDGFKYIVVWSPGESSPFPLRFPWAMHALPWSLRKALLTLRTCLYVVEARAVIQDNSFLTVLLVSAWVYNSSL